MDRMLAELRGDLCGATQGAFSLDREKAREKMRVFQLPDPRRYVLELVQAAVCKGATGIRFDVDADDLRMRFDGAPFTIPELDDLYAALFRRGDGAADEALRELALGLNAAMALHPRWVRVQSGDGDRGVELVLRPGEPDRYGETAGVAPGTEIHVKSRLRPGLLVSFFRNLAGALPEEAVLRGACGFSRVPVDLEGQALARGLDLPDVLGAFRIDRPGIQGSGGFPPDEGVRDSVLHLVKNGVWIQSVEIQCWPRGYTAVVDGQRLRKDASQSSVVRDEAFDEVVEVVRRSVAHSVAALARSLLAPEAPLSPAVQARSERLVKLALQGITSVEAITGAAPGSPVAEMAAVPLWPRLGGGRVSLAQLVTPEPKLKAVGFVTETFTREATNPDLAEVLTRTDRLLIHLPEPGDQEHLQGLLGEKRFRGWTGSIKAGLQSRQARNQWLTRKASPTLRRDQGFRYLVTTAICTDQVTGELGLLQTPERRPHLRLIARGCLLCEVVEPLPFSGLEAALEALFLPTPSYTNVSRFGVFTRVIRDVLRALPALHDQLASLDLGADPEAAVRRTEILLGYLRAAFRPGFVNDSLVALGVSDPQLDSADDASAYRPTLGIGVLAEGPDPTPGPIARVPLLRSAGQDRLHSLEALATHLRDAPASGLPGIPFVEADSHETPEPGELVLRLRPGDRELLEAIFGPACLRCAEDALRRRRLERSFLDRPTETARLAGVYLPFRARFRAGSPAGPFACGEIGFEIGAASRDQPWNVRLLRNQRYLAQGELGIGLPPARAVVSCDALTPLSDYEGAENDATLARVRTVLRRAGEVLLRALGTRAGDLPGTAVDLRRSAQILLRSAVSSLFPRPYWGQVWRYLARSGEEGERLYARLHDLLARHTPDAVQAAFRREHEQHPELRFLSILADLEPSPPDLADLTLEVEVALDPTGLLADTALAGIAASEPLPIVPTLRSIALLPGWEDEQIALDALLEHRAAGRIVSWVPELTDLRGVARPDGPLVRVDAEEATGLENLLGEERLRRDEELIDRAKTAAAFRGRATVKDLDLVDALVTLPLEVDGIQGTLGISRVEEADARLGLHRSRKLLGYHWSFSRLPVVGALEDDRLTPNARFDGAVEDAHLERILARCRERIPDLYARLVDRFPLPPDQHRLGRRRLLEYLADALPGWDGRVETLRDPVAARIAELPLFEAVEGHFASPRRTPGAFTLLELGEAFRQHGQIIYCAAATGLAGFDPGRRAFVATPEEALLLGRVLSPLVDFTAAWRHEWVLVRARIDPAQRLPGTQDLPTLVRRAIQTDSLAGELFLPGPDPAPLEVQVGYQRCRIGALPVSPVFPCAGRLEVAPAVLPFILPTLAPDAWRLAPLDQEAIALYQDLAAALPGWEERSAPELEPALEHLRGCITALHRRLSSTEGETPEGWRSFYRVHRLTRVFRLADGRLASLARVIEHRPPELAALGLWPGSAPDPAPAGAESAAGSAPAPDAPASPISHPDPAAGAADPAPLPAPPLGTPTPPAPPPAPGREERLAAALIDLLNALAAREPEPRSGGRAVLRHLRWSDLRLVPGNPRQLLRCKGLELRLHARHPLVARVLDTHDEDPVLLAYLASAIYSAVNLALEEIDDDDERRFHRLLASHLVERGDCP
jgi:hypothetical protein